MKKRILLRLIILLLLFLLITLNVNTRNTETTIWYVHPDSTLNTIQSALDSCSNNDIVLVAPGAYVENIIWPNTQGIHLISELGIDVTIIDGDSAGSVISINTGIDSTTIIRGFSIKKGHYICGGGIFCDSSSSPTITNNTIIDNTAYYGGGICCKRNSSPSITNNTITGNTVRTGGAGIHCDRCSLTITSNTITGNTAIYGNGGGIQCYRSSSVITSNVINGNSADGGGGICCYESSSIIKDNTITDNAAHLNGGGIFCGISSFTITGNTINNNTAYWGGGIDCSSDTSTINTIDGNIITDNTAYYGGGIQCFNVSPTIRNNIINCNIADSLGGGIYCVLSSSPTIDSCTIYGNNAHGLYIFYNSNPIINYCNIDKNKGFGIYNSDSTITINALFNWWGDASGPYHPDSNPGGLGCTVSDYVAFIPWLTEPISGVEEEVYDRELFFISKSYPNPFMDKTHIEYHLSKSCNVNISIYNTLGARIRVLLSERQNTGEYTITWDGSDENGNKLPGGFYFLRFKVDGNRETRKLLLLR